MKPRSISWPDVALLLALAGGGMFWGLQQQGAKVLAVENAGLSERIRNGGLSPDLQASADDFVRFKQLAKEGRGGMKKLADLLRASEAGDPSVMSEVLALDTYLRTLDATTLESMITAARSELSGQELVRVEDKLLDALGELHPDRAFAMIEQGFAGLSPSQIQRELSKRGSIFETWLKRDGTQALAWLDRQIAAGRFESRSLSGTSDVRQQYESLIYRSIKDPSRIAALDPLDRLPTLQSWRLSGLSIEDQAGLAKVARTSGLGPSEVAEVMKPFLSKAMESGGLAAADEYFSKIDPTEEELPHLSEAAAGQAMFALGKKADQLTGDEVPAIREWLAQKSSEGDAYIGSVIGQGFSHGWDAGQIYATMERLQKDRPSDDLLVRFLLDAGQEGSKQKLDPSLARDFANRISDPAKRELVLNAIPKP